MNKEDLIKKLSEDLPEEMCIDFEPLSRKQIAEHFISQFLVRPGYGSIEKCFSQYAYMLTSIILSWRAKTSLADVVCN